MKRWIFTWRVQPPVNTTVSVRFGSSVCFAAYSKLLEQWYLIANGSEEKIDEPPLWFCEDEYAAEHQRAGAVPPPKKSSLRKKKDPQLLLFSD